MRKTFAIATVMVSLFAFAPSQAKTKTVTAKHLMFNAPFACTTLCAHNFDGLSSDVAEEAGTADPTDAAISTCGDPFPIAGYADFVVTAPKKSNALIFTITPQVDWDSYICSYPTAGKKSRVLASGANSATDCAVACIETTMIKVKPGTKYILRAYNWADVNPCAGHYKFVYVS